MSLTYAKSKVGYSAGQATFSGRGQFYARKEPSADFVARFQNSSAQIVLLARVLLPVPLYKVVCPVGSNDLALFAEAPSKGKVIAVLYNGTGTLVRDTSLDEISTLPNPLTPVLAASPGRWGLDGYYGVIIRAVRSARLFTDSYIAVTEHTFSTVPKSLRGSVWQPRIQGVPSVSLRIPNRWSGISQIAGGRLTLAGNDGYFDAMPGVWDGGEVFLELGVDLPGSPMAESEYLPVGSWRIESASNNDAQVTLVLREPKSRLSAEIPVETLTRETSPAIADELVGRPVPLAYGQIKGAKPILLDATTRRFGLASHRIRAFNAVRVKQTLNESAFSTPASWVPYLTTSASVTIEERQVKNVEFAGDDLTPRSSLKGVTGNAGSWYQDGSELYVRPPAGQSISSGLIVITTVTSFEVWKEIQPATVDLATAQFTLGADWDRTAEVSVDFEGRVLPNGELMTNPADLVADLLDYIGETEFDADSFNEARRAFHLGYDRYDQERNTSALAIYLEEKKEAQEVLQSICRQTSAALFVDLAGRWRYVPFIPKSAASLRESPGRFRRIYSDTQILTGTWTEEVSGKDVYAGVQVEFAKRLQEGWAETVGLTRRETQWEHNLAEVPARVVESDLMLVQDAYYHAQRLLTTEAQPLTTRRFTLPWFGLFILPGDQLRVTHARAALDEVLDVIEVTYDFAEKKAAIVAGDRQSWRSTFGFWVDDSQTVALPTFDYWFKADSIQAVDAAPVEQWPDSSPNARHATVYGGSASVGYYRSNLLAGKPAVQFSAGFWPTRYLLPNWPGNAWTAGELFFIVKALNDPAPDTTSGILHGWSSTGPQRYSEFGTGKIKEVFGSTTVHDVGDPAAALTAWRMYHVRSAANSYVVRLDNTDLYTSATNTVGFNNALPLLGVAFAGWVAECIIVGRTLTTNERSAVIAYLSSRYQLSLTSSTTVTPWPAWDPSWTNEEANERRLQAGYWHGGSQVHGDVAKVAPVTDFRSYRAGRWF